MSSSDFLSVVYILRICITWLMAISKTVGQSLTERRMTEERASTVTGEYCERESFEASCSPDEVILMRSALYGRMQFGRCVQTEYGAFGCSADVLRTVDGRCSGRRQCLFPITDLHGSTTTCPRELLAYLEASYECIPVLQCSESTCSSSGDSVKVPPVSEDGFLASGITSASGCGSVSCPWLLQAKPGQRLNVTFYSFVVLNEQQQHQGKVCQRLATISEPSNHLSKDVTVCNRDVRVTSHVTEGNTVKVKIYPGNPTNPANFVVYYRAVGCPDFDAPFGGWAKRDGNLITVGCNDRQRTWHLTCDGLTWVGQVGDCDQTDVTPSWNVQSAMEKVKSTTGGILMVIGLGILIGVVTGCSLLIVAIVVIKRRRRRMAFLYDCRREALYSEDGATILDDQLYARKAQSCPQNKELLSPIESSGYDPSDYSSSRAPCGYGGGQGPDAACSDIAGGVLSYRCSSDRISLTRYHHHHLNTSMASVSCAPTTTANIITLESNTEHAYETPHFST